jgi:hypothetical protein
MCGWNHVYTSDDDDPGLVAKTCPGRDGTADKAATLPLVLDELQEIRTSAAQLGADAVVDVRCFVFSDRSRLWCEGAAVAVGRR